MTRRFLRGGIAGLVGGIAWLIAMQAAFGPAQAILQDPARQSAKMLSVFAPGPDQPRTYTSPAVMVVGIFVLAAIWGLVFAGVTHAWKGPWWRRGLLFGLSGFLLMAPWFEFYLPWNVLREPAALVALELLCWWIVLECVGLAIAGTETLLRRALPDREELREAR